MTMFFRRALLLAAFSVVVVAAPAFAQAEEEPVDPPAYQIVFPVAGENYYTDNFGDCRDGCSRSHEGTDIMADKGTPVVAAADGRVVEIRGWNSDGSTIPGGGQWLIIDHGGWQTWYLHLNNDTYGTNDGLGKGIAPDIISAFVAGGGEIDYPVFAGQLIGWVGNSGAEWAGAHLHFEMREGASKWDADAFNAYPYLQAAIDPPAILKAAWNGVFADDDSSVHEADIEILASEGTTKGCNPPFNTLYCPERLITRGEIAAFINRTMSLPASEVDYFGDDDSSVFNADINAVMAAGIGFGCSEADYCPDEPLLRAEMAELLVRAFADLDPERYSNEGDIDYFVDDEDALYEGSINRLMAAGVTKGCNPPDNDQFCPERPLNRAEMASFFVRALGR